MEALNTSNTPHIVSYVVIFTDRFNGNAQKIVSKCKTLQGARRSIDRKDNEYGSYAHGVKAVYSDGTIGSIYGK